MKQSHVVIRNGNPVLCIGGEELSACAYMTYFDERNDYGLFSEKGFRIYSVSVSFASQPINTGSGFMPYEKGVFDTKGSADFSSVDEAVEKVLTACPNAYIFPRIYVCMPEWWIQENPSETVDVPHGKKRESLYSEKFREDAAEMLKIFIEHFKSCHYSDNIFGYQISGGNTQEWFHLDENGSYSESALPYFNKYLQDKYPGHSYVDALPDITTVKNCEIITDELVTEYLRFASDEVAETVEYLCKTAKEAVNYSQLIGAFYGYTAEVSSPLRGTHALAKLLDSENIDFISSPNSYVNSRSLGVDWADMIPVDSLKLHGKMCFMECDIRTFLSMSPNKSRKGSDRLNFYTDKVWVGPPTDELSVYAIRKSLARQLTHKHGLWWFDMFGHWYATDKMMNEMEKSLKLYNRSVAKKTWECETEVAVFLDEESFSKIGYKHPAFDSTYAIRTPLGQCGAPYKFFLINDFERIDFDNAPYKAVIFSVPYDNGYVADYMEKLFKKGIAGIRISAERYVYTAEELYCFFKKAGVHIYSHSLDVFYIGNGFVCIHAVTEGEKEIRFPEKLKFTDTETGEITVSDRLKFNCKQFETRMFEIDKA